MSMPQSDLFLPGSQSFRCNLFPSSTLFLSPTLSSSFSSFPSFKIFPIFFSCLIYIFYLQNISFLKGIQGIVNKFINKIQVSEVSRLLVKLISCSNETDFANSSFSKVRSSTFPFLSSIIPCNMTTHIKIQFSILCYMGFKFTQY